MAKRYTEADKRAYYSGMGYAVAHKKKGIPFKNEKNKESFRNGYKKGVKLSANYPNLKKKRGNKRNSNSKVTLTVDTSTGQVVSNNK